MQQKCKFYEINRLSRDFAMGVFLVGGFSHSGHWPEV